MTVQLRDTDIETLETLALRIGPLLAEQYAAWQMIAQSSARRRLAQLVSAGWVDAEAHAVRELPLLDEPLLECDPGGPEPDYGHWAYIARNRYRGTRTRRRCVYYASQRCYRAFGVSKRSKIKPHHVNHDLGVTACYFKLLGGDPSIRHSWRHEDHYVSASKWGQKVPDVLLVNPETNEPTKGIDFIGATYSATRLRELSREILESRKIPLVFY